MPLVKLTEKEVIERLQKQVNDNKMSIRIAAIVSLTLITMTALIGMFFGSNSLVGIGITIIFGIIIWFLGSIETYSPY
jgi:preprotein translocase subunit SecF